MQENNPEAQAEAQSELRFGPFRLAAAKRLLRGDQLVDLRPQSLAMLRYLAERSGQVVAKKELLKQLWPRIYVSPTVVKVCVREVRHALGDDAAQPRFIETVGAQGYRFIAPLATAPSVISSQLSVANTDKAGTKIPQLTTDNWQPAALFVGRAHELSQLQTWSERARQGEQQIVFVSGEAGIGKTTLVEHFLTQAQAEGTARIGRGHCIEQHEHGEAYLPVLQALQQLCRGPNGDRVVAILRRHAPMWLVQLAGVVEVDELETLQRQVQGSSPKRMLREFAAAIEQLAAESAVLLFFEDLQWSDSATLELLAYLAQQRTQTRMLVLGTYRPAETVTGSHPLRSMLQKLVGRGQCHELALELFTETEVEAYLTQRLAGSPVAAALWPVIHRRTEGNALFVMHFVNYLIQHGLLTETGGRWEMQVEPTVLESLLPDHVRRLIGRQLDGLSTETQQVLEVASVVGMTFTASEVAAVANCSLEAAETICDDLANQGQLLEVQGLAEWPNAVITVRYRFRHALYQHELYHRIGLAQRVRWHRQIGEHFTTIYGERPQEIAGELAFHFERGRDYRRAILYRQQAGEHALRQNIHQKALVHGQAGITLLAHLPATAERDQLELGLRQLVSVALATGRGFTDDKLERNLQRAWQLCRELHNDAMLVPVVVGLTRQYLFRADRAKLEELARQEEALAERVTDRQLLVQLHTQLAWIELIRGKHACTVNHYQQVSRHYDLQARQGFLFSYAGDPLVVALAASGVSLSLTGRLEQGWREVAQGLARAEELHQLFVLTFTLLYAGMVKHLRGEWDEAERLAQKMIALAREHELPQMATLGALLQGGTAVHHGMPEEGIPLLTTGLARYHDMGAQLLMPYFLSFLAEGYWQQGRKAEALQTVNEALSLTTTNLDVFWEAELYRQKGQLTLQQFQVSSPKSQARKSPKSKSPNTQHLTPSTPAEVEAEACFLRAIDIAREQGAKLLELRAVMSLSRLWQSQGKKKQARQMLAEIYNWFTEGLDTKDLQEAKALLAELT
jgi:DNA-binding winged helix-turn-helix (wHTH) protein/predicted ATPase